MKAATLYRLAIGLIIACSLVFGYALLPTQAKAEEFGYAQGAETFSQEELAQMLAPIALYPDALLSQVLMASTYPIEVIEADRWRQRNPNLRDEALDDALAMQNWDPSVKALCHFPGILALMSERIGETTDLGNAFLAQEEQVMDTVQHLRTAAYAAGNLASGDRQTVVVERETIIIEPADPRIVYVPYYDPYTIYGRWRYPAYAPWYWGPPGVSIGFGTGYWPGFYFSFSFGNWSYFDWHRHYIHIDIHKRPRYVRHDRWLAKPGRWQHTQLHRRGVAYRDKATARTYGQAPRRIDTRREVRGFPEPRSMDRNGRHEIRTTNEGDRPVRQQIERQRSAPATQSRQRVERAPQERSGVVRNRPQPAKIETNRSVRARIEHDRQQREQMTRETRQQRQIHPEQRQVESGRKRQPQPSDAGTGTQRQAVEKQLRQQNRDSVFTRVDEGRRERQSSERGRSSRQGQAQDPRSGYRDRPNRMWR